jgi:hypothetical protein
MATTFDIPLFRTQFPEFASSVTYPTSMILFWSNFAEMQLPQNVWCKAWLTGVSLYTAHEITLAAQNVASATVGGVPGTSGGIANTKTVGGATVGYDSAVTSEKDAGYWNLTNYGKQLIRLIRIFGTRPVQL